MTFHANQYFLKDPDLQADANIQSIRSSRYSEDVWLLTTTRIVILLWKSSSMKTVTVVCIITLHRYLFDASMTRLHGQISVSVPLLIQLPTRHTLTSWKEYIDVVLLSDKANYRLLEQHTYFVNIHSLKLSSMSTFLRPTCVHTTDTCKHCPRTCSNIHHRNGLSSLLNIASFVSLFLFSHAIRWQFGIQQ